MKIITYLWEKRKILLIASITMAVLFFMYAGYNTLFSENIVVSFIYPSSEKGQYPDGTRLNIYDILSDDVLEDAVASYNEEKGTALTIDDVSNKIIVREYVSPTLQEKVETARNSGLDYFYFANEFTVKCEPIHKFNSKDGLHLFGLIANVNSKLLLEKIYESYTDFFMNEHTEMNVISRLTSDIEHNNYDYLEKADLFESRINMYVNYLQLKNNQNGSFVSTVTGMSFNDLIVEFENLNNLQVQNLKSFVSASKLAKNTEEFINKLKAENESNWLKYNILKDEADLAKNAMMEYDHTFEENIVITGVNDEVGLYQARPKTAYDSITKRALDKGVEADNILKDINENDRLIATYGSVTMDEAERARLTKIADDMVAEVEKSNDIAVDNANKTVEDFLNQKSSDYIKKNISPKSLFSVSLMIKVVMVFCFGLFVTALLCFVIDFIQKNKYIVLQKMNEHKEYKQMLKKLAAVKRGQRVSDVIEQEFDEVAYQEKQEENLKAKSKKKGRNVK